MYEGFRRFDIQTSDPQVTIRGVVGGSGPPVLLLHGNPLTYYHWRFVAPRLAKDFTVVATDLRGYGDSGKPRGLSDHRNYSFRRMAQDQVDVMRHLGFERFMVAGHDRGARTAYRMTLDHPAAVQKLCAIDILPTHHVWTHVTREWALNSYHWSFMAQPYDFPERLLAGKEEYYIHLKLGSQGKKDLEAGNKIACPVLVIVGGRATPPSSTATKRAGRPTSPTSSAASRCRAATTPPGRLPTKPTRIFGLSSRAEPRERESGGSRLPKPRNDLLREQLERLQTAVPLENALAEQQEDFAERHVARRILDHARDGVGVADQERRAVLAEGDGPRVPHPETVLGPGLGFALRVGEHEVAAPRRFFAARHVATVGFGHLAIATPEH